MEEARAIVDNIINGARHVPRLTATGVADEAMASLVCNDAEWAQMHATFRKVASDVLRQKFRRSWPSPDRSATGAGGAPL